MSSRVDWEVDICNADWKISGSTAALVGKRQMDGRIETSAHDLYVGSTLCLMRIPPAEDFSHRCAHLSSIWNTHADTDGPFCLYSLLVENTFLHKRRKKRRTNVDSLCELVRNYMETWDQRDGQTQQNRWTDIWRKLSEGWTAAKDEEQSPQHCCWRSCCPLTSVPVGSWRSVGLSKCLWDQSLKENCEQQIRHVGSWSISCCCFRQSFSWNRGQTNNLESSSN